ncbi:MAG: ACP S-malonyltransferase [Rickettsiales bacterium]|jgi:[acyl-carrier-protein] S-malonyltransferase|nr:ACP S-malonyltransferase [Rickettsiales bacterium]
MSKAFVFPGQGSQVIGMGKDFFNNFDVAKRVFQEVDDILKFGLSNIIFEGPQEILTDTENAQPAIMCVSIAILRTLEKESGKKINDLCDYVAGHSLGEYTALCASGALTLSDTAKLLKIRGKAFSEATLMEGGGMCALLGGTIEQVQNFVVNLRNGADKECIQIANDNANGQVVISGSDSLVNKAVEIAKDAGFKKAVKLNVSGAFHSKLMSSAVDVMQDALNAVKINVPLVKFVSNVDARITQDVDRVKQNLLTQINNTVRWRETILLFEKEGVSKIVEFGNKTLAPMVGRTVKDVNIEAMTVSNVEELKLIV